MKKKIAGFLLAGAIMFGTLAVPNVQAEAAEWKVNQKGWWYQDEDGGWSANEWRKINGQWYWFDSNGYMATGWRNIGGTWYYLHESGAMLGEGWHWLGEKCYYMHGSGAMAANTWIGNDYVDNSGAWIPGKVKTQSGWIQNSGRWWYRHADGSYTRNGWEKIGGQWYLFDNAGWMLTGWQKVGGTWYYLQESGAMLGEGWHWIGGKCYYMYGSGAMAANTWIGNDYVDGSGAWVPGKTQITTTKAQAGWVQSGNRWWYRHADGSYTRNGWEKIGGQWYYFDGAGWMLANQWVGDFFVTGSGAMATNTWIGSHYVGADGAWIPGYGVNTGGSGHTHTWKEEWHLEPVAEVGHWDKELVAEAWDEPVKEERVICNGCGMDITDRYNNDTLIEHVLVDVPGCTGGYHVEKIPTGEVIHHEAEYKEVWIVDQAAYDKKVIDGYTCSCGATK